MYVHAQSSVTCIVIIELMIVFTINLILVKIDRCLRHAWARQNTYYSRHIKYYVVLCVYSFEMLQKPKRNSGVRVQPFNLQGGLWFFVSFRIFFPDSMRVIIFIFFCRTKRNFFSPEFNIRLYDKNTETDFFSLHQNQNIFFSNIGNQKIYLEKNHNLEVK